MLTFNLKKEWFEKIKSGEKTHEYREVKPYWTKRLLKYANEIIDARKTIVYHAISKDADLSILPTLRIKCCFKNGYPKKTDKNNILYAEIVSINKLNGKNTDLKIDKPVYDIEFELIIDN